MIPVTKPFQPPLDEYFELLKGIWERQWFTNNGPLVIELQKKLNDFLGTNNMLFLGNGTIALQIAIKALGIKGEILTTPFSYVATTSSIVWEGCKPVFVDIDENTFNIDPQKIESKITKKTKAILATHCFGNPCDVEAIDKISNKYGLKVIYDAAHCFGTKYMGESIFKWGDISTTSFHATKLFHTIEGGAVFTKNEELFKKMIHQRNFGHDGPDKFNGVGINGKNSEFHAAMGILNLNYIDQILTSRKNQVAFYDKMLSNVKIKKPKIDPKVDFNNAYYPIVFETHEVMMRVKKSLELKEIFPRRYFYPSLSSLNYIKKQETPVSDDIASRILCLPLFFELSELEIEMICRIILKTLNN
ncbi:MAG: DegT/DnrJ/EryC1/StrS family aminotransferase [Cecembia sp.]